jgi:hypothetical protein
MTTRDENTFEMIALGLSECDLSPPHRTARWPLDRGAAVSVAQAQVHGRQRAYRSAKARAGAATSLLWGDLA